jgi:hypothetical protein
MIDLLIGILSNPAVQTLIIAGVGGLLAKINSSWAKHDRWATITGLTVKVGLEFLRRGISRDSAVVVAEMIVDTVLDLVKANPGLKNLSSDELLQLKTYTASFVRSNLSMANGVSSSPVVPAAR